LTARASNRSYVDERHIHINYKREEQATARKLANALESEGWTVWWNPEAIS
jgi:hypothetical protein